MYKLVVLFAFIAIAQSKSSGLGVAYSAVVAPLAAVPAARSHTFRSDVISKPVVAAVPVAAPALVAAPVLQKTVISVPSIVPAAISHTYRSDVVSKPIVAAYAAPVLTYSAHVPAVHAW